MKYVAFLRGINISGKNKISMNELKKEFEKNRYKNVITCLNSGNIIFESLDNESTISNDIHLIIKNKFNIDIPIYIIKISELKELVDNKPNWFTLNDKNIYNNIIFIIPPHTYQEIYNVLGKPNELLEQIHEYKNNIFWSYNLKEYRKTNWWSKTANTSISNYITIRTFNTITKILEISKNK